MKRGLLILLLALATTAGTYGGAGMQTGVKPADIDRVAPDASRIPGDNVWGGYLKTPDDMIPRFSIRFDDMGSRPDLDTMAESFLSQGIPVSIGVNAWSVGADDSTQIAAILASERQHDTNVEWYQHTNGNMVPNRVWSGGNRPGNPGPRSNSYITLNSIPTTDIRYYSAWHWNDWVAELDPTPIIRLTGERPTFVVWPGDGSPNRRRYVQQNVEMFEALFDTLGYDFGITGITANDSLMSTLYGGVPDDVVTEGTFLQPFMFAEWPASKVLMPMPSTRDLSDEFYVERFAPGDTGAPSWVPAGTTRWTLRGNVTPWYDGAGTAFTDYSIGGARFTFRWQYTRGIATGGGDSFVFHSIVDTDASPITATYPSTPAVGGTLVGSRIDLDYMAAACAQLEAEGLAKFVTVSEHVKWLASRPGKPGMMIAGSEDFKFPWAAIGDSAGCEFPYLAGIGSASAAVLYPPGDTGHVVTQARDTTEDGKLVGDTHAPYPHAEPIPYVGFLPLMARGGSGGNGQAIIQRSDAFAGKLRFNSPPLLPGVYRLEWQIQNSAGVDLEGNMTLQPGAYAIGNVDNDAAWTYEYNFLDSASSVLDSLVLYPDATVWTPYTPSQNVLTDAGGKDHWSQSPWIPDDLSHNPWWNFGMAFRVPEVTADNVVYSRHILAAWLRLDRASSGTNQHSRIAAFRLRWMGE